MTGDETKLEGIGGWLILVAIGLCVQPMLLLKAIADNVAIFEPDTWRVLTTPGAPAYHPLWAPLLVGETGVNLVLFAWSGVLLYVFFARKRGFPRLVVAYMGVSLAAVLGDLAVARAIPSAQIRLTASDYGQVGRSAISAAVWIPYFLRSRRVAATFIH
jgi:uncharacterized protein DUF2569